MVFFIQAKAIPDCSDMALFSALLADRRNKIFVLLFYAGLPKGLLFLENRTQKSEIRS